MKKLKVGVLGATGAVGQRFIQLLAGHPWFRLTALAASGRSAGKPYREVARWFVSADIPAEAADLVVQPVEPGLDCDLVFSALPSNVAREVEQAFAGAGYGVFSNASAHRYDEDVPLVTAEVNPDHLDLLPRQQAQRGWARGFITTNSNCSAMPLVITLAPLHRAFGVKGVVVQTMQALSGAGYPGVPSLDALDNVIPYIAKEEEKMGIETAKMMGTLRNGRVEPGKFPLSAHCNRVASRDGHLETVSIAFERPPAEPEALIQAWRDWQPLPQQLGLPSAPVPPIVIRPEPDRPQTRLDRDNGQGMAVTVGRVRPCPVLDYRYVLLAHNTIRGAAGASVLNAELMKAQGLLEGFG
ncbi:MAG: aspartate-semialdehyde dehydrogenase [Anaerolineae bacterium]